MNFKNSFVHCKIWVHKHPSGLEYPMTTWSGHQSSNLPYLVCYALFESIAHKHLVDSCFIEKR